MEWYCDVWCPDCADTDYYGCFDGESEVTGPYDTQKDAEAYGIKKCYQSIWQWKVFQK